SCELTYPKRGTPDADVPGPLRSFHLRSAPWYLSFRDHLQVNQELQGLRQLHCRERRFESLLCGRPGVRDLSEAGPLFTASLCPDLSVAQARHLRRIGFGSAETSV